MGFSALDQDAVIHRGKPGSVPFNKKTFWLKILAHGQLGRERNRPAPVGEFKVDRIQSPGIRVLYLEMFLADVLSELMEEEGTAVGRLRSCRHRPRRNQQDGKILSHGV
jgi:hypothetical protein